MRRLVTALVLIVGLLVSTASFAYTQEKFPKAAAVEVNTLTRRIDIQTGVICYSVSPASEHLSCLRFPELLEPAPAPRPRPQQRA